jgi:hypothetical protein
MSLKKQVHAQLRRKLPTLNEHDKGYNSHTDPMMD